MVLILKGSVIIRCGSEKEATVALGHGDQIGDYSTLFAIPTEFDVVCSEFVEVGNISYPLCYYFSNTAAVITPSTFINTASTTITIISNTNYTNKNKIHDDLPYRNTNVGIVIRINQCT